MVTEVSLDRGETSVALVYPDPADLLASRELRVTMESQDYAVHEDIADCLENRDPLDRLDPQEYLESLEVRVNLENAEYEARKVPMAKMAPWESVVVLEFQAPGGTLDHTVLLGRRAHLARSTAAAMAMAVTRTVMIITPVSRTLMNTRHRTCRCTLGAGMMTTTTTKMTTKRTMSIE